MRDPDTDFELAALTSRHLTLLETGDYHDFVLKAGGRSFKESDDREATLEEHDPEVVEQALLFLYAGSYADRIPPPIGVIEEDEEGSEDVDEKSEEADEKARSEYYAMVAALAFNTKLYLLADFLNIKPLLVEAVNCCGRILREPSTITLMVEPIAMALSNTRANDELLRPRIIQASSTRAITSNLAPHWKESFATRNP